MPAESLKRVHAPIGLDIGAVTPQEIAVSILAELIAVKHGKIKSAVDAAGHLACSWQVSSQVRAFRLETSDLKQPLTVSCPC